MKTRSIPILALCLTCLGAFAGPLRQHPKNPRYLELHYACPEAVDWNRGLGRVIGYDETGFAGRADATYRRQAWNFVMSGGGLFNHLDYSFTVGQEDGTDTANRAPGGGSPALRRQLRVLAELLRGFDLALLASDSSFVRRAPGALARTLSAPGKAYATYFEGRPSGPVSLNLPPGRWQVEWLDPIDGCELGSTVLQHSKGVAELDMPAQREELALGVVRR
jgi:hypothetical protein